MTEHKSIAVDGPSGAGKSTLAKLLAKELGFDAGFGAGTYADDVITFAAKEIARRMGRE